MAGRTIHHLGDFTRCNDAPASITQRIAMMTCRNHRQRHGGLLGGGGGRRMAGQQQQHDER